MQSRMKFEQKYLKIDRTTEEGYRQEHLNMLKEQSGARYTEFTKNKSASKGTNTSLLRDTNQSPSNIKRPHKLSEDSKIRRSRFFDHDLSLKKQYDMKVGHLSNHGKVQTERSVEHGDPALVTDRNRAQSSMLSASNTIKYRAVESKPLREYKHYDIIKNSEKIFVN